MVLGGQLWECRVRRIRSGSEPLNPGTTGDVGPEPCAHMGVEPRGKGTRMIVAKGSIMRAQAEDMNTKRVARSRV